MKCGICHGNLVDMVVGMHLEKRCLRCQPLYPRGQSVITMPSRPSVPEAMERTEKTLAVIEKEERKQGLSWRQISEKQANAASREKERQELSHQKAQETIALTNSLVSEHRSLEMAAAYQKQLQERKEYWEKCFREISENEGIKVAEKAAEDLRHECALRRNEVDGTRV